MSRVPPEVNESYAEVRLNTLARKYIVQYVHASPFGPLRLLDEQGEVVEDVLPESQASIAQMYAAEQTLRRMDISYNA